jgi:hypothetical protein
MMAVTIVCTDSVKVDTPGNGARGLGRLPGEDGIPIMHFMSTVLALWISQPEFEITVRLGG